tara:strand:+ start:327 stop:557 length:231 start_codon:yes stop_codon:yes gene_type:complete
MNEKGFETEITLKETPNFVVTEEKPLNFEENRSKKVDINILKARAQKVQDRESRKNILTLIFFLLIIGIVGIYLSI